jgi:hypothetical protein
MLALFVVLGGAGLAATGGNFILGQDNTADQQTKLTGTVANPQLRVENASDVSGARAIVGRLTSTTAAAGAVGIFGDSASPGAVGVLARNTAGGSALSAVVNSGVAPLIVNSNTKVANLNADRVDGSDIVVQGISNGLGGSGRGRYTYGRDQLSGAEAGPETVIFASGIANVNAEKNSNSQCSLTLLNSPLNGNTYTFVRQVAGTVTSGTIAPGGTNATTFASGATSVRWQAWVAGDPLATARVITVDASAVSTGTTCDFAASMYVGGD